MNTGWWGRHLGTAHGDEMATKWQTSYTGQSASFNGAIASLIDDFVGAGYQRRWHREPERFRGLEVDREFEFGRLQERQIGWLRALENTTDIDARLVVLIDRAGAVAYQAAGRWEFAPAIDCRYGVARSECDKDCASICEQRIV